MKTLKKITLLLTLNLAGMCATVAQETTYAEIMSQKVAALDTVAITSYSVLASDFSRISAVQGSDWLAAYYAAYCRIILAFGNQAEADKLCEEANLSLNRAESLGGDQSEIACLRSMAAKALMLVNPQERWQTFGAESGRQLSLAIKANPTNPRAYFLQAQDLFYTPAQYGGGKEKAMPIAQKSVLCFDSSKVSIPYAPHWGEKLARQLLKQCRSIE